MFKKAINAFMHLYLLTYVYWKQKHNSRFHLANNLIENKV